MPLILGILLCLFCFNAPASILVIPGENSSAEDYLSLCQKEGYICIDRYVESQLRGKPLKAYDLLIEQLDVTNLEFRKNLSFQIKRILETEPISVEHVRALISIIERTVSFDPKENELSILNQELKDLLVEVERLEQPELGKNRMTETFETYFVLQKRLRHPPEKLFKTLSFRPYTIQAQLRGLNLNSIFIGYHEGPCHQPSLTPTFREWIGDQKYVFHIPESCRSQNGLRHIFSDSNASKMLFDPNQKVEDSFLKRNSKVLIWSGLILGAVLFSQNYELIIE